MTDDLTLARTWYEWWQHPSTRTEYNIAELADLITAVRAEGMNIERERCAQIADRFVADGHRLIGARAGASLIAAAIRAADYGAS